MHQESTNREEKLYDFRGFPPLNLGFSRGFLYMYIILPKKQQAEMGGEGGAQRPVLRSNESKR